MDEGDDSKGSGRRLIDSAVKAGFVAALRTGTDRTEAAEAAGFPLSSLYNARARDSLFAMAWEWAMDLACIDERAEALPPRPEGEAEAGEEGEIRIVPCNGRLLRRRRIRWVKFNEKRQQIFLDRFAGTADAQAAAAAAGVTYDAVRAHYRKHPEFASAWHEALRIAYATLEAEAVRQRLEAQRRLSDNLEPTGEMSQEFERVMKLLARFDRRDGRIAPREVGPAHRQSWTFDEAIVALDRKLRALGLRHGIPDGGPPEADPAR